MGEKTMIERICRHCGNPESEHCFFEEVIPLGCVCDPGTWLPNPIGPVCEKYIGDGITICETCEHEKECHVEANQ